jgi:hypothetical protein
MAYYDIIYGEKMSKVAVIVETRKHKALPFVLNNVMSILPSEWSLQIFHGSDNLDYVMEVTNTKLLNSRNITYTDLEIKSVTADDSSLEIMLTENFWNQVVADTVLYFECDSMLCPDSKHKVGDFEDFDYIGGYWGNIEYPLDEDYPVVMNGGFSIRKKQFMLDIIKNNLQSYLEEGGNPCEDYFVSSQVKNRPTTREVRNFSIDNGYISPLDMEAPFAVHKPWGVTPSKGHGKYYNEIKQVCNEVEKLQSLQEEIKWWGK